MKGLAELRAAVEGLKADVQAAAERAVTDGAADVRDNERRLVPVDSGDLRDGIKVRRGRSKKGPSATVGIWDPDLKYAVWIEWGRSSASAQPFVTPAAEIARVRFLETVVREVKKVLP